MATKDYPPKSNPAQDNGINNPLLEKNPALELLRAMRPHQWVKNFLIFVPVFTGHHLSIPYLLAGLEAFLCFSLCASALYLVNDVMDLKADKIHPLKKNRPFAAGTLPPMVGILGAPLLVLAAFTSAMWLPLPFIGVLGLYLVLGICYSFWLKRLPLVDILILASMYTLRVIAGGAAANIPISMWLLAFSILFFTSLAVAKRYVEIRDLPDRNRIKAKGRGYTVNDEKFLMSLGIGSSLGAVVTLGLYANSMKAEDLYQSPSMLWFGCIILFFWLARLWIMVRHGLQSDDLIVFALTDKISLLMLGIIVLIFFAAGWV